MIKLALKHFIYEKCINVLFENVLRNFFKPPPINLDDIRVGDRFSRVIFADDKYIRNVKVTKLYNWAFMGTEKRITLDHYSCDDTNWPDEDMFYVDDYEEIVNTDCPLYAIKEIIP